MATLASPGHMFYFCSMSGIHVVWFKKDLRVHDHAALTAAAASGGRILPLYIVEPGYWNQPEHSRRQFDFLKESLDCLADGLGRRGSHLVIRTGEAVAILCALHRQYGIEAIHAHQETGTGWTYERDKAVRRWTRNAGIPFREYPQNGVLRGRPTRSGWAQHWEAFMRQPRHKAPSFLNAITVQDDEFPAGEDLGLGAPDCPGRQRGGRRAGIDCLQAFLHERAPRYRQSLSSPVTASSACSRLSPHFAFGTLSLREAFQASEAARQAAARTGNTDKAAGLTSFISRLQWHCHFIQKFEDAPSIEFGNQHPSYDGLRHHPEEDDERLNAWIEGRTGFPFLDACMRSLRATGWLNFRMRAMLLSFATHHLWLDWKRPSRMLGALFTDFEPGIHYPQVQMQSATTGTGIPRIYNPVKQSMEQDRDGNFIRQWVPELGGLPAQWLHTPWQAPASVRARLESLSGKPYPAPIIDHLAGASRARAAIREIRSGPDHAHAAAAITSRHGSAAAGLLLPNDRRRIKRKQAAPARSAQLCLNLLPGDTSPQSCPPMDAGYQASSL